MQYSKAIPKKQVSYTKKQQILNHLLSGKTLTQWECTQKYRHLRLGSVIHQLRQQGYDIMTITTPNADGVGTHAKYVLRKGVV